jgi:hypothetical protein
MVSLAAHPSGGLVNRVVPGYLFSLLPTFLVLCGLVAALMIAASRRNRLGAKAFNLLAAGLVCMILAQCLTGSVGTFFGVFGSFSYRVLSDLGADVRLSVVLSIVSLVTGALWITGLGLVIGAVFAGRPHRTEAPANAPRS